MKTSDKTTQFYRHIIKNILEVNGIEFDQIIDIYPDEHSADFYHVISELNNEIRVWDLHFGITELFSDWCVPVLNVIKTLEYRREQLNK